MRKSILALSVAAAFSAPMLASAEPPSPVTGNMSIVSDYRFRGISQTYGGKFDEWGPAIQGGVDYSHPSGIYVGNWNSSVASQQFPVGSGIEMDFYVGWKTTYGDIGLDIGTIYYYYPNAEWNATVGSTTGDAKFDNWEIYFGATWKWLSGKIFYALSDYFGLNNEQGGSWITHKDTGVPIGQRGGSDGTVYFDLSAVYPVNKQLSIVAHYGMLKVKNYDELDYNDWKLGVTYDLNGWILGAAYVDSDADSAFYYAGGSDGVKETGKSTVVLSVTKTF